MKCKLNIVDHHFLIEERPPQEKVGSIVMPESVIDRASNDAAQGTIVALGPNCFDDLEGDYRPKIGTVIYFTKYDGWGYKYSNKNYRILHDKSYHATAERYLELEEDLFEE